MTSANSPIAGVSSFRYDRPDLSQIARKRKTVWLGTTDRLFATIQAHREGGEVKLHSHTHLDGFWFVLAGRVRFYSDETTVYADIGRMEGVLIPRGDKYWFEAYGPDDLEIFQIECSDKAMTKNEAREERGPLASSRSNISRFHFDHPQRTGTTWLAHTDRLFAGVEVENSGASLGPCRQHQDFDSVWYVLEGAAAVTPADGEPRNLGSKEGVLIHRGEKYQIKSVGKERLVALKVFCASRRLAGMNEFHALMSHLPGD